MIEGKRLTIFIGEQSPKNDDGSLWLGHQFPGVYSHPRTHGDTADWYIATSKKEPLQILTLSESFFYRVKRRIAEGVIATEDVKVYAEVNGDWKEIQINEFGATEEHCFDLFGSVMTDAECIMRAALLKRNAKRDAACRTTNTGCTG